MDEICYLVPSRFSQHLCAADLIANLEVGIEYSRIPGESTYLIHAASSKYHNPNIRRDTILISDSSVTFEKTQNHYRVEQKNLAKFSDIYSVRTDGLCLGSPRLVDGRKVGN